MLLSNVTFLILILKNLTCFFKEKVQVFIETNELRGLTRLLANLSL
jgi:hypothetical protein